jgi:hypothetical protein
MKIEGLDHGGSIYELRLSATIIGSAAPRGQLAGIPAKSGDLRLGSSWPIKSLANLVKNS